MSNKEDSNAGYQPPNMSRRPGDTSDEPNKDTNSTGRDVPTNDDNSDTPGNTDHREHDVDEWKTRRDRRLPNNQHVTFSGGHEQHTAGAARPVERLLFSNGLPHGSTPAGFQTDAGRNQNARLSVVGEQITNQLVIGAENRKAPKDDNINKPSFMIGLNDPAKNGKCVLQTKDSVPVTGPRGLLRMRMKLKYDGQADETRHPEQEQSPVARSTEDIRRSPLPGPSSTLPSVFHTLSADNAASPLQTQDLMANIDGNHEPLNTNWSETDLTELTSSDISELLGPNISPENPVVRPSSKEILTRAEMRVRMVEYEQQSVKHDLQRTNAVIQYMVKENTKLASEVSIARHELAVEREQVYVLDTSKREMEKELTTLSAARDAAVKYQEELAENLSEQESTMNQTIKQMEQDQEAEAAKLAEQKLMDEKLEEKNKKISEELDSNMKLLNERNEEISDLKNATLHKDKTMTSLEEQIHELDKSQEELLAEMQELNSELEQKEQDVFAAKTVAQVFSNTCKQLQKDKAKAAQELASVRDYLEDQVIEVSNLTLQLNDTSEKLSRTEENLFDAAATVETMKAEANSANSFLESMETTQTEAMKLVKWLNSNLDATLLKIEEVDENQTLQVVDLPRNNLRVELEYALHQVEQIRTTMEIITLTTRTKNEAISVLKEQCKTGETLTYNLEHELKSKIFETESLNNNLKEKKGTIEQHQREKQLLEQDVKDLVKKLSEKKQTLAWLEQNNSNHVEKMQEDHKQAISTLDKEILKQETELKEIRSENSQYVTELAEKEQQLSDMTKDLEAKTKTKDEIETRLERSEIVIADLTEKAGDLHFENIRLNDALQLTEAASRSNHEEASRLKDELREQCDKHNNEARLLHESLLEQTEKYNAEKGDLERAQHVVLADLNAAQASITLLKESRDELTATNEQLNLSIQDLKTKVQEEITATKLMEQKAKMLKARLIDTLEVKNALEKSIVELKSAKDRLETDLSTVEEDFTQARIELSSLKTTLSTKEQLNQLLSIRISDMQADKGSLVNQLVTSKHHSASIIRSIQMEFEKHVEDTMHDRIELTQQLSIGLKEGSILNPEKQEITKMLVSSDGSKGETIQVTLIPSAPGPDGHKVDENTQEDNEDRMKGRLNEANFIINQAHRRTLQLLQTSSATSKEYLDKIQRTTQEQPTLSKYSTLKHSPNEQNAIATIDLLFKR